jgi:hypothetical protein
MEVMGDRGQTNRAGAPAYRIEDADKPSSSVPLATVACQDSPSIPPEAARVVPDVRILNGCLRRQNQFL